MTRRRLLLAALGAAWLAFALAASAALAEPRALEHAPPSMQEWIESLPEAQRHTALRRLGDMPAHRRNRLFHRWQALEEGERRELQERMLERMERGGRMPRRLDEMSPESREKLAPLVRRWRGMEPAERRRMRQRLERFRTLAPEDQEALIEKRYADRPAEERARILDSLREASRALPRRPLLDAPPAPDP